MKTKETHERISEIAAEMASITEFAEGSMSSSSNSYSLKDGTRRKAKPHWKFQSLGARGERKYRNVPESLVPRVKRLIANGRRYRKLEKEYARLVTEESLDALKRRERGRVWCRGGVHRAIYARNGKSSGSEGFGLIGVVVLRRTSWEYGIIPA